MAFCEEKFKSVTSIPIWLLEAWRHMQNAYLANGTIKGGD
jgi:hypothetical protein